MSWCCLSHACAQLKPNHNAPAPATHCPSPWLVHLHVLYQSLSPSSGVMIRPYLNGFAIAFNVSQPNTWQPYVDSMHHFLAGELCVTLAVMVWLFLSMDTCMQYRGLVLGTSQATPGKGGSQAHGSFSGRELCLSRLDFLTPLIYGCSLRVWVCAGLRGF